MDARNIAALAVTLPSDLEIVMTRAFNAPRRIVFDAWTRPEHFKRWFGCRHSTLVSCDIDLRLSGTYRFVSRGPDGRVHTIHGVYHEILPPSRLVFTEHYFTEGFTSNEALVTMTFEERDGQALFTRRILHQSREDRDMHRSTGMEKGWAETFDRLDEHLEAWLERPAA